MNKNVVENAENERIIQMRREMMNQKQEHCVHKKRAESVHPQINLSLGTSVLGDHMTHLEAGLVRGGLPCGGQGGDGEAVWVLPVPDLGLLLQVVQLLFGHALDLLPIGRCLQGGRAREAGGAKSVKVQEDVEQNLRYLSLSLR